MQHRRVEIKVTFYEKKLLVKLVDETTLCSLTLEKNEAIWLRDALNTAIEQTDEAKAHTEER